jgi:hypothetical protein
MIWVYDPEKPLVKDREEEGLSPASQRLAAHQRGEAISSLRTDQPEGSPSAH